MYKRFVKRAIDIVLALLAIFVSLLPTLIIAIAIKIDSPGAVVFRQKRLGLHGREFYMYKFRTMCENAESIGGVYCKKGDARVTRVGHFLRETSIDELPQFFNVLKGDMSLIGPRPPLTYHPWPLEKYTDEQRRMFDVRPGITGWAQVHGRKEVEWDHRIELNVWYVNHVTFKIDLLIFIKTVAAVLTNADNENSTETAHTAESVYAKAADKNNW